MKRKLWLLLASIMLVICWTDVIHPATNTSATNTNCIKPCEGYPFLLPRSQGQNGVRDLVGWQEFIHQYDAKSKYGDFAITLEYDQSMRANRITQFYFGDQLSSCNGIAIQGSLAGTRHPKAWLADYFSLPQDYSSVITFDPIISNFIMDLQLYMSLDASCRGTYLRVDMPLVHTKWDMNTTECIKNKGTLDAIAGYISPTSISRENLSANSMTYLLGNQTVGDITSICFGKFPVCPMKKTRLADIRFTFGWDFYQDCDYHIGVFLNTIVPTGNRPNGCYLFEPIVGNGKHWELGAGLTASYIFWRSDICEDRYLGIWFDATCNHLFKTCQRRSFDFCNMPNSRYMLLEEMETASPTFKASDETTITDIAYQYTGKLLPAVNYTTIDIKSSIALQADLVLKFGYTRDNWNFDFGYNFWARTGEKFCNTNCSNCIETKKYAFKGDAFVYGYLCLGDPASGPGGTTICDQNLTPVRLSASQSEATLFAGKNYPVSGEENAGTNPRIDTPLFAYDTRGDLHFLVRYDSENIIVDTPSRRVNTSTQPKFVSKKLLNLCKSPSAITHKLFLHINHTWKEHKRRWLPFLGFGGSVELDHTSGIDCCNACSSSCCDKKCKQKRGGISQWGAWLKGGIYFE